MKIKQLFANKQDNLVGQKPVTIAFLGDSVTQGCYECYLTSLTSLQTVFDYKSAYSTRVKEILNILYPNVQINVINSGISGDSARVGLSRIERDILSYNPDLVVVSYGLNDAVIGDKITYLSSLESIFATLKKRNIEVIFLTQNFMNTDVSVHLRDELFIKLANDFGKIQNEGRLKEYFEGAKALCENCGVEVVDLYSVWEKLYDAKVNVTELLSNKLNHPIREFHYYMAMKIVEKILLD